MSMQWRKYKTNHTNTPVVFQKQNWIEKIYFKFYRIKYKRTRMYKSNVGFNRLMNENSFV